LLAAVETPKEVPIQIARVSKGRLQFLTREIHLAGKSV